MKTQQIINHGQIAQVLTVSCEHLDEKIVTALRQSRTIALQRQSLRRVSPCWITLENLGRDGSIARAS